MKNWILIFTLFLALTNLNCTKEKQTFFEDAGKKMDQGMQKTEDKIDRGIEKTEDKIEQGLNTVGDKLNEAGEKVKEVAR